MGQYDALVSMAKSLLARKGESSKLVRTTPGTPSDPNKPWEPGTPIVTETTVSAAYLNRSILRDDAGMKSGESFVILAASDLTTPPDPSIDGLKRASGTRYTVLEVHPLDPSGQAIIYELKVKN